MKKVLGFILILTLTFSLVNIQSATAVDFVKLQDDEAAQYKQGLLLIKQLKNEEAFEIFKQLYAKDAKNVNYAHNLSFCYSKVGYHKESSSEQLEYYAKAKEIAQAAIDMDDNSAGAHYSYALALARENENASTKTKISNAKRIKTECDKAIELNPKLPGPYHIMGRWHRTFAGFNSFKRTMVNTFYGGTPKGGTYADALEMFQTAIKLEPTYKLHIYELSVTYYEMKKHEYAKKFLEKAMALPVNSKDAKKCQKECQELMDKLD